MGFRMTYLHLTLTHSEGQNECHAHIDLMEMVKDMATITFVIIYEIICGSCISVFMFDVDQI